MWTRHQQYFYLLLPFLVTVTYCASAIGFSNRNLEDFFRMMDVYAAPVLMVWLFLGLGMMSIFLIREGRRPDRRTLPRYAIDMLRIGLNPAHQIMCLTPPLIFVMLMAAYGLFKQVAIPQSGFWAGPVIMSLEYHLLLGHHAWELTHGLLPVSGTYWLDQLYNAWFVVMVGSMLICSYLSGDPLHRCRFVLCFVATWIVTGSALAYLLPASGPVYFAHFQSMPDPFVGLKLKLMADDQAIRALYGTDLMAPRAQAVLLAKLKAGLIIPGGGISAMPSMHNAIAILVACAAFDINRILGWLVALFAGSIYIGSVHLGWHYALDGVVAALVSGGIWASSGEMLRRYERRLHNRRKRAIGGRRATDRQQVAAAAIVPAE